jgi:hypothetical protein
VAATQILGSANEKAMMSQPQCCTKLGCRGCAKFTTLMPCRSKKLANLSFNISLSAIQLCILSIYLIKQPGTEFGASNVCKMSERVDPQCWDRFKNAIRGLYIANGHKLEGPDGVIEKMEERHGFKAA